MNIERYFDQKLLRVGGITKSHKIESKSYLDWIRAKPCIITGTIGCDAHHVQRKSHGTNDFLAIPLSHAVHVDLHNVGFFGFESKHGVDLKDAVIAKLVERVEFLEERLKSIQ